MVTSSKNQGSRLGFSLRSRIALAMLVSAGLILPVTILALYYLNQMNTITIRLVEQDIGLLRVGQGIVRNILDARRSERNFLLTGDTTYLITAQLLLRETALLAEEGRREDQILRPLFDSLNDNLIAYSALIDSLARMPRLRLTTPDEKLTELRSRYQMLLQQAQTTAEPVLRESLFFNSEILRQEIEMAELIGTARTAFHERLQQRFNGSIRAGERVISRANQLISEHRARINRLFGWSQRNIVTALIMLTILIIYLISKIPRAIILPVKRISNALLRAEKGELDINITINANDELGNLGRQLNRVFGRLREFDQKKANYILELEHRFRAIAGSISEGVLVVNRDNKIVYANPAIEPLLGVSAKSAIGRGVEDFANLRPLLSELELIFSGASSRQECEIIPALSGSAVCFQAFRDPNGTVTNVLVVVTNPTAPTEGDAEA